MIGCVYDGEMVFAKSDIFLRASLEEILMDYFRGAGLF